MNATGVNQTGGGFEEAISHLCRDYPTEFRIYTAGLLSASQVVTGKQEPAALPAPSARLDQIFAVYQRIACVKKRTVRDNVRSLLWVLERVHGSKRDPAEIPLTEVSAKTLALFQEKIVAQYCSGMQDGPERREAMERALRTSRSIISQSRSVFAARNFPLIERYESENLIVPACVREFVTCKLRGSRQKKIYKTAPDEAFRNLFTAIQHKRAYDPTLFIGFHLCIGGACRAGDVLGMRWENLIERDGKLFAVGIVGKNGRVDEIQIQKKAADAIRELRQSSGPVVDHRAVRRLNRFLRAHGILTQKASHELRAWTLAQVWMHDGPGGGARAAQQMARHSSLTVTEASYVRRYIRAVQIAEVL